MVKLISGAQDGTDIRALELAAEFGLSTGGTTIAAPSGPSETDRQRFGLSLVSDADVAQIPESLIDQFYPGSNENRQALRQRLARTRRNVLEADLTLIVLPPETTASEGTAATVYFAESARKLYAVFQHPEDFRVLPPAALASVGVLNVAGPRLAQWSERSASPDTVLGPLFQEISRLASPAEPLDLLETHARAICSALSAHRVGEGVFEGMVPAAMEQLYTSRTEFMSTAQHTMSLQSVVFTGAIGLAAYALGAEKLGVGAVVSMAGAVTLLLALVASFPLALRKLRAGYDLYGAATFHAAAVHQAVGLPDSHAWFELVRERLRSRYEFSRVGGDYYVAVRVASGFRPSIWSRIITRAEGGLRQSAILRTGAPSTPFEFAAVWRSEGANLYKSFAVTSILGSAFAVLALLILFVAALVRLAV